MDQCSRKDLQRRARAHGIRATQPTPELRRLIKAHEAGYPEPHVGSRVARTPDGPPGVVLGIGDQTLCVRWPGHRIVEVSYGRDGVYDVTPVRR